MGLLIRNLVSKLGMTEVQGRPWRDSTKHFFWRSGAVIQEWHDTRYFESMICLSRMLETQLGWLPSE